jgi:hypothetical protein
MIDWFLKHPILIFLVIAGVSSLLKKLKPELGEEKPAPSADPQTVQSDFDEIERTRRIQEEIRRKIAERRGQLAPQPEPLTPSPRWTETVEERSPYKVEPPPMVKNVTIDPVLERQRELAEQLAALKLKTAQHVEGNRVSWAISKPAETEAQATVARAEDVHGLRELRNARSLRKAMILREVLGPPVALR